MANEIKYCEYCGKEITEAYGSGRFCSVSCAHGFSTAKKRNATCKQHYYCLNCNKEIINNHASKNKFCSVECASEYQKKQHYQEYLNDNSIAYGQQNMQRYKKYFLEEQRHKCAICGCGDIWQGKSLIFILDHIDGNADNNARDNLRLVCPNCDSQLDTFKSKNKNSARAKYRNIKVIYQENT